MHPVGRCHVLLRCGPYVAGSSRFKASSRSVGGRVLSNLRLPPIYVVYKM